MIADAAAVRDARPPAAVLRVLNPVVRLLLRSPAGRLMGGLAELHLTGRRTGRYVHVTVGWHEVDGRPTVFTPAGWRANFAGGAPVLVRHQGTVTSMHGTLQTDPSATAAALRSLYAAGTSPRATGLAIDGDHAITTDDVARHDRAMITFERLPSA